MFIVAAAIAGGCGDDEVRHYDVPKAPPPPSPHSGHAPAHADGTPQRLLGAVIPRGSQVWFFKVVGPAERLEEQKEGFVRFLSTVRFSDTGAPPVTWTLPDGWRQKPATGIRFATLVLG